MTTNHQKHHAAIFFELQNNNNKYIFLEKCYYKQEKWYYKQILHLICHKKHLKNILYYSEQWEQINAI